MIRLTCWQRTRRSNKRLPSSTSRLEATWAQDGSVSVIHPASTAPILGWEGVQKSYADHPVRYKDFAVVMDNPQVTIKDNVAWVVGIEKVYAHRANGDVLDISALATNIFEKRSGKWLLVHHHASRMPSQRWKG